MATRWSQGPNGVRAVPAGPSRGASVAAALVTLAGTTLALLILAALLLPGMGEPLDGGVAVASPTVPAGQGSGSTESPAPVTSGAPQRSGAPDATPAPVRTPAATRIPSVTRTAAPTPATEPSAAPVQVALRAPAPVTRDGVEVGRVTVRALRQAKPAGAEVEPGLRVLVANVRVDARLARLPYDELHFVLEDDAGERHEPVADLAANPLGTGTLAPSTRRSGQVAFTIPEDRRAVAVVLTDGAGADLVVFSRSQASS